MQKLINVIALLSGLTSAALIGGSAYLLLNKDAMIESAKEQAIKQVTASITEALPGMISGAMPELPKVTGPAVSAPTTTGPAIPF
jgi:hypothetical protein